MVSPYIPYYVGGGAAVNPEKPTEKKKEDPTSTIPAYTGQQSVQWNGQSQLGSQPAPTGLSQFSQGWSNFWQNMTNPANWNALKNDVVKAANTPYYQWQQSQPPSNSITTVPTAWLPPFQLQQPQPQGNAFSPNMQGATVQQFWNAPAPYSTAQYHPSPAYQPGQAPMGTTWWTQPGYQTGDLASYDANAQYQYYSQMAAAKPAGAPKPAVKPQVQAAYGGYSQPVYYGGGRGGGGGYSYSSPATPKRNVVEGVSWRI